MSRFIDAERLEAHRRDNLVQTAMLLGGIGLLTVVSTWLLWGIIGSLIAIAVMVTLFLLGPRVRPETVMRLYRAERVDQRHGGQLLRLVGALAERAELPATPGLYVVPSMTLNAFATGKPGNPAIAVTEGMLRRLSLRELAGVLGHEMSHIRNNDLLVMGLADVMTRLTQMLSYVALGLAILNIPTILLGGTPFPWLAILLLYLAPAVSSLLQLALSRAREFDADLEGAGLTGDPEGLASALAKLDRLQGRFWEDLMLPPARKVPYPSLLRSHPETDQRIARLADLVRQPEAPPIVLIDEPMFSFVGLGPGDMTPRRRWPGLWY